MSNVLVYQGKREALRLRGFLRGLPEVETYGVAVDAAAGEGQLRELLGTRRYAVALVDAEHELSHLREGAAFLKGRSDPPHVIHFNLGYDGQQGAADLGVDEAFDFREDGGFEGLANLVTSLVVPQARLYLPNHPVQATRFVAERPVDVFSFRNYAS